MSKAFVNTVHAIVAIAAVLIIVTTPFIKEECLVCGRNSSPVNSNNHLRTMSIVEWSFDTVGDVHFSCLPFWDLVMRDAR